MAQAKSAAATAVCPQCKTAVEKDGLQRHLDWSCPAAPVACGECDAPSTRGGVAKHMAIDCKATDSSCPLAPYGCTAKVKRAPSEALKRAAFDAHMIASRAEHHKMLTKQIDAQKSLRSALQKQVDAYDFDLTCLSKETKQLTAQLHSARQTRGQLTAQLSEYSKLIAGFNAFVREKIKANPALSEFDPEVEAKAAAAAGAAGAADEKKGKTAAAAAAGPAAAAAAAAGAGAAAAKKDAKESGFEAEDKALQDYADAARGADALMIQYKAKPATALALADWLSKLKAATNSMQQFGRASVTDVQHMAVARCYRVSEYKSVAERRVAAEYINTYYAVRGQTQQVGDALRQLLHAQRLDSALVWALCCGSPLPPDTPAADANLLDSIAMEAAKNLMDGKRMADAFDRVMARGPPQGDDLSVMWMFAATLGRWSVVKELSKQVLELNPKAMELVHENALQNPNVPDMSVLTDMCVVESVVDGIKAARPRPDSDVTDLLFMAYEVRSMVIKLVTVTHPDPQIVAEVKAEYADYPNGKDLVLTSAAAGGRVIACSGAVANMLSVVFPISLTGPCTPGNITLSGFADQQIAEGVNVHSTEYLSVNKQLGKAGDAKAGGAAGSAADGDAESGGVASTWSGEFKLTNTRTGGDAAKLGTLAATFHITFELFGRSTLQLEEPVAIGVPDAAEVKPKKGGVLGGVDLS